MTVTNNALARVLEGADSTVRIQDDLFRAINGSWIDSHEIPTDLASDGSFTALALQAEEQVRQIIEELAAANPTEGEAGKIARLFNSWMDVDTLNAKGTAPLEADLAPVEAAANREELARAVGALSATGVHAFFSYEVASDLNDPSRYTVFVSQSGIGLPDEAYYRDPRHAGVLAEYEAFVPRLLALGYSLDEETAAAQARVVLAVEREIAAAHMSVVDTRDVDKVNNPFTWTDFLDRTPGFAWNAAFEAAGAPLGRMADAIVANPDAIASAARLWNRTPLEDLKAYTRWRILQARAPYLTEEIDDADFDFYGRVLRGTVEQRERWKRGVRFVQGALGEAVGKEYVARHFPPSHKERMLRLVDDLLEAYRQSFRALDWMGDETKRRALEKCDSFVAKIGYPDEWRDYSALRIGDDLLDNARASARFKVARDFAKLGEDMDRSEWLMSPQTVNAYYNPLWNEIVFPAAILQFPFFDPDRDDALNYGAIGAVIGHEIGHGFDDQGSKFDANGAIDNWWTDEDRRAFEERTSALVAQYDAYVPAQFDSDSPHHVRGALTLGENIGDLGGVSIGLKAYGIALARQGRTYADAPVIDGYTGVQRFFLSYARVWQSKDRTEALTKQIATDPHSPDEFRTNGVVKNVDAFAEAFGVTEGDALYLPPEERVRIW